MHIEEAVRRCCQKKSTQTNTLLDLTVMGAVSATRLMIKTTMISQRRAMKASVSLCRLSNPYLLTRVNLKHTVFSTKPWHMSR